MQSKNSPFQGQSFEKRCEESSKILAKYPDRVPVICFRAPKCTLPEIDRKKFLVPGSMLCYEFKYTIVTNIHRAREEGNQPQEQVIYLLIDNKVAKTGATMADLYDAYKSEDGFLYMTYTSENTLGL
mmetsp:Transcript_79935/g.97850  ORF Transcript_79935/g.97850 Transcript_79935/m.97850 type:complete len:127 (+) Transcript_79935:81-461(+)